MRQNISYDSDDYSGSVIFWIILICLIFFCFFWWPTPNYGYADNTVNYANNTGWGWGWGSGWTWGWIILACLFFWWICTLCFAPMYVDADDDEVRIRRPFKTKRIRMDEIASAEPYTVSKKAKKKFLRSSPVRAFGKWGQYSDDNIGDYFAYYGKPDNTVLITLKNGKKYVVGGSNSKEMAEYINSKKK